MATPKVITGTLSDITGAPASTSGLTLRVRLSTPAWITGGSGAIVGQLIDVPVAADGSFEMSLYSNSDLTPANTYYVVTLEDNARLWRPAIVVPGTSGPFVFPALIVSSPAQPAQYVVGPQGPAGVSSAQLTVTAGVDISAHRAVVQQSDGKVYYADPTNAAHRALPIWMSLTAASSGATLTVQTRGEVTEPSWTWTPGGAVFVAASGVLTQTYVDLGAGTWTRSIGTALDATTVFVDPQPAIVLAV